MKSYAFGLCALSAAIVLAGCETPYGTPDRTGTGALTGGAIGAFSGAVLGGRNAGEGALIGGAIGAITGGLIGHSMDEQEQERLRAEAPQTYVRVEQGQPLAVADVKAMVSSHVSDDVIISQIQNTHSIYHLSAPDIIDLHNAGVSEKVIQYMINTSTETPTPASAPPSPAPQTDNGAMTQAPPPPPVETVVPAPNPGYVWSPGAWQWNGRWIWMGGYWASPPYPRAVWIGGYWSRGPYGWHWMPGRWH
jgi:outer membrane lipoprotein SlyB